MEAFDMLELGEDRPVGELTEASLGPVGTVDIARGDYWARVWPGPERDRVGLPEGVVSWRFEVGFVCPKDGHDLDGPVSWETFGGWRRGGRYVLCGGHRLVTSPGVSAWSALRSLLLELQREGVGPSWSNGWVPDARAAAWSREAVAAIDARP